MDCPANVQSTAGKLLCLLILFLLHGSSRSLVLKICFCLPSQAAFCWAQRPGGLVHRSYSSKPPEAAGKLYSKNFLQGRHVRSAHGVASLQSNVELKENLKIAAEAEGATETERCRKQTPTVEQEVRLSTPQHFRPKNIRSHSSR